MAGICDVCGGALRVVGRTTQYYEKHDHTPERTPGQGDFGRWDATDDPDSDETLHPFALNQPPYKPSEVD